MWQSISLRSNTINKDNICVKIDPHAPALNMYWGWVKKQLQVYDVNWTY